MEAAEKVVPEFYIPLFGERRKLSVKFGTLIRFEAKTGRSALNGRVWANPSMTDIVTLFWAALGGEAFGKTVEQVADEMSNLEDPRDIHQWRELIEAIMIRSRAEQKKIAAE